MNVNLTLEKFPFLNQFILHSRITWSIRLRWFAVVGYLLAALAARFLFDLPLRHDFLITTLILLTTVNLVYYILLKVIREFSFVAELIIMHIHIVIDLIFLTVLLHFSGGIDNPVYLFFLFHVVLSSIIFPGLTPLAIATLVCILFSALVLCEYTGLLPHYSIYSTTVFQNPLHISVLLIVFTITVYFTAYICMTFMKIYRESKRIIDRQNRQLIEAGMEKTRFYQFASHELKSPLIAIKTSVDVIFKNFSGSLDQKALNLLSRVSARSAQMLGIITDLLELSKEGNPADSRERQKVRLNRIIGQVIDQEQIAADAKKINLNLSLSENDGLVEGNSEDFEKIFSNLIGNAIRYSSENSEVTIESGVQEDFLFFSVSDQGIGIKSDDLNRIFDEFYRTENAKQFVNLGTGLGLSLTKKLVEKYKGRISVTSELGQGSTFKVQLPIIPSS